MKAKIASLFDQTWLTSSAMVLFIVVFVVMLFMVLGPWAKRTHQKAEQIPLNDEMLKK
jgi:cbb3-type cytochrome oxidase subunit 3